MMDNNAFFRKFYAHFGAGTPDGRAKAVAWEDRKTQFLRFEIAASEMQSGSLMDVGCGLGDFAEYLKEFKPDIRYYGIDKYPMFAAIAKASGLEVREMDLYDLDEKFDYIYSGGVFTIDGNIRKGIEHLLALANKKLIVNALHSKRKLSDNLQTVNPDELVSEFGGRYFKDHRLPIDFFYVYEKAKS